MRAIRFEAFGDPSVLNVAEARCPRGREGTALVRVMAASINPSDVKNVAGAMKQTTLPRIPGRDFAGVVEAGPAEWIGAEVWGTGGDVGFTRDGTHAELIAVPVASLRRKPETLSFDAGGVGRRQLHGRLVRHRSGGPEGRRDRAADRRRRRRRRRRRPDRPTPRRPRDRRRQRAPRPDAPIHAIAEKLIIGAEDLPAEVRAATGGKGADVVFDLVGGVMFRSAVNCLALARPAGRNRRDRPARSELRPCRFLSQRKPAVRRGHAEARP